MLRLQFSLSLYSYLCMYVRVSHISLVDFCEILNKIYWPLQKHIFVIFSLREWICKQHKLLAEQHQTEKKIGINQGFESVIFS